MEARAGPKSVDHSANDEGMTRAAWAKGGVRGALRLVAIGGILLFSYASLRRSIAWSLREHHIELAYEMAPDDARVAAAWASWKYSFGEKISERGPAVAAAKTALRRDATAVQAVATLALDAEADGERSRALALARFAQFLSRRDLRTQLFLLQAAVEANDISTAMTHYDYVLRTSDQGPSLLFPVLRSAIAYPEVRASLIRTLTGSPPWGRLYLYDLADKGPNYDAGGALLIELRKAGVVVPGDVEDRLITRLVERGDIGAAWRVYHARFPEVSPEGIRDGNFETQRSSSPFDWTVSAGSGASALVSSGRLEYGTVFGAGGVAARQLLVLPQGRYRLSGGSRAPGSEESSLPAWRVRCIDGTVLGEFAFATNATGGTDFADNFSVPKGCEAQWLELVVPPGNGVGGDHGTIEKVKLEPINR